MFGKIDRGQVGQQCLHPLRRCVEMDVRREVGKERLPHTGFVDGNTPLR